MSGRNSSTRTTARAWTSRCSVISPVSRACSPASTASAPPGGSELWVISRGAIVERDAKGAPVVAVCAAIEAEIADMEDEDRAVFLADIGMDEPGLDRVIRAGYALLGLQTYFTAGPKEVRAWTVKVGATAPQAAGVIHTDFERGFIRAEVIAFDDYIAGKGEQGAKEAGRMRLEGKEYVVRDGDVMHFRFNV